MSFGTDIEIDNLKVQDYVERHLWQKTGNLENELVSTFENKRRQGSHFGFDLFSINGLVIRKQFFEILVIQVNRDLLIRLDNDFEGH